MARRNSKKLKTDLSFDIFSFNYESVVKQEVEKEIEREIKEYVGNYVYTLDECLYIDQQKSTMLDDNFKALKILNLLRQEHRLATNEEKKILAHFSGWGAFPQLFRTYYACMQSKNKAQDEFYMKKQDVLKGLITEEEYTSCKEATVSSFYTPTTIIKKIWQQIEKFGFKGGKILEPSLGIGRFIGLMPKFKKKTKVYGHELDTISGDIAKALYPEADISISGFETNTDLENTFDLVVGNVPFGTYRIYDPAYRELKLYIHNYFLAKSIDLLKPGGIMAFIVPLGTMNASHEAYAARMLLKTKANFLGAIRLPNNVFNSTKTATDIIFLQKKLKNQTSSDVKWTETVKYDIDKHEFSEEGKAGLPINEYFFNNPNMVLGNYTYGQYKSLDVQSSLCFTEFEVILDNAFNNLPVNIYHKNNDISNVNVSAAGVFKEYILKDNLVYKVIDDKLIPVEKHADRIAQMVKIKCLARKLMEMQQSTNNDAPLITIREKLNYEYDYFYSKFGPLNSNANKKVFVGDPDLGLLLALEVKTKLKGYEKADIFRKRTMYAFTHVSNCDNPYEALQVSLREYGGVKLDRIAELCSSSIGEVIKTLDDLIYLDPQQNNYVLSEEYLSGNVKEKLAYAKKALEEDSSFNRNIVALSKVQPEDIPYKDIFANLGASWIPAQYIEQFAHYMLELEDIIEIRNLSTVGAWKVILKNQFSIDNNVPNTVTYGTNRKSFLSLLDDALNQTKPIVRDRIIDEDGKEKYAVNQQETLAANQKMELILKKFNEWIWDDDARRLFLARLYNNLFNNCRLRTYNGGHIQTPGLNTSITLWDHQKNAVWRILCDKSVLLAHCVGAGKTYTMQVAAMELRRLGLAKKPIHVIPNVNFPDYCAKFRYAYPAAKLLVISSKELPDVSVTKKSKESPEELEQRKEINRQQRFAYLAKIMTGDWDSIIISHEVFKRIAVSAEMENEFFKQQIEDLETAIWQIASEEGSNYTKIVKQLETQKMRLVEKLRRDLAEHNKDIAIPFETLGIDHIFVDESDVFKNLTFQSKLQGVAGIQNQGSQRSMDMFMKMVWLQNNNKGCVFATGTPISNSIAEMYTVMRYLYLSELRKKGIAHFDSWAANFGEVVNSLERSPDGSSWKTVLRFANFINVPELITMFRSFADVKNEEDLNLPKPELETGNRIIISAKPSVELKHYVKEVITKRVMQIKNGLVKPDVDNMLVITNDMRKASLDYRLINPLSKFDSESKIGLLIKEVFNTWKATEDTRSTQVIFCDLSTPKPKRVVENNIEDDESSENIVIYDEIKRMLVTAGIPKEEIAFIHDAKNNEQKVVLHQKVREGIVRIILGSTNKLGVGTNIQDRLIEAHHLDCPWRPRDITQREGRILRQGNMHAAVRIKVYVTEESADAWLWQTVKAKAKFISQALSGSIVARKVEDISQTVLGFAEIEALATGNPLIMEKFKVDNDIEKYTSLKSSWQSNQYQMKDELLTLPNKIQEIKCSLDCYKKDLDILQDMSGDKFKITLNGKLFTERGQAQDELRCIVEESSKNIFLEKVAVKTIGSFAGFDLDIYYNLIDKICIDTALILKGSKSYESKTSIQSLEYIQKNMPGKMVEKFSDLLLKLEKKQLKYQMEINQSFEYEELLNSLLIRQKEIYIELGIDKAQDDVSVLSA